jgi:hypothetical protein
MMTTRKFILVPSTTKVETIRKPDFTYLSRSLDSSKVTQSNFGMADADTVGTRVDSEVHQGAYIVGI